MPLFLVEGPTGDVVSLDAMKGHLRVDHDDEDDTIEQYTAAVVQHLDGRDGWLGRALRLQVWDLKLNAFCESRVRIPLPPLISVEHVKYYDEAGVLQTLATSVYQVAGVGGFGPGCVELKQDQSWPTTQARSEAVAIRFCAGYVDNSLTPEEGEVPGPIISAIKLMVGSLYEHREHVIVGQTAIEMPWAAHALLAPLRVHYFA